MKLTETLKTHARLAGVAAVAFVVVLVVVIRGVMSSSADEEAEVATLVPVSVTQIVSTTMRGYVDTWGTVEPEPASEGAPPASARVASAVSGIVAAVKCMEGQPVRQGAVLFTLDSRVADIAVTRARQALEFAEQVFARQKKLGPGEATSQRLYAEAEQNLSVARNDLATAVTQRALLDITAPLGGTVVKVTARPGDAVDLTSGLAEIIDLNRLVVTTGVRSTDVSAVRRGQTVILTAESSAPNASPSKEAKGKVISVGARIESTTDQVTVRASIPAGAGYRPGQLLRARIAVQERHDRLAVPVESVVSRDGVSTISVVEGDRAVRRSVTVGLRDGNLVEVAGEGLRAGMTVVTSGAYGLPDESRIRVVAK